MRDALSWKERSSSSSLKKSPQKKHQVMTSNLNLKGENDWLEEKTSFISPSFSGFWSGIFVSHLRWISLSFSSYFTSQFTLFLDSYPNTSFLSDHSTFRLRVIRFPVRIWICLNPSESVWICQEIKENKVKLHGKLPVPFFSLKNGEQLVCKNKGILHQRSHQWPQPILHFFIHLKITLLRQSPKKISTWLILDSINDREREGEANWFVVNALLMLFFPLCLRKRWWRKWWGWGLRLNDQKRK